MRIIAGQFRSRRLKSVPGLTVRPTPDRLREALFNVLAARIEGSVFVDAYAGSGAVGLEALSRGAKQITVIERSSEAVAVIRENLRSLQVENQVNVLRGRAAKLLLTCPADIVFIDPPYELADEYRDSLLAASNARAKLVIAQHSSRLKLHERYGELVKTRVLQQGDNSLSFFAWVSGNDAGAA